MKYLFTGKVTIAEIVAELGNIKATDIILETRFDGTIGVEFKKDTLTVNQEAKLSALFLVRGYTMEKEPKDVQSVS